MSADEFNQMRDRIWFRAIVSAAICGANVYVATREMMSPICELFRPVHFALAAFVVWLMISDALLLDRLSTLWADYEAAKHQEKGGAE